LLPNRNDPDYELRYQIMDAHPMVGEYIARLEAERDWLQAQLDAELGDIPSDSPLLTRPTLPPDEGGTYSQPRFDSLG